MDTRGRQYNAPRHELRVRLDNVVRTRTSSQGQVKRPMEGMNNGRRRPNIPPGPRRMTHLPPHPACRKLNYQPLTYVNQESWNEIRAPPGLFYFPPPDVPCMGYSAGWDGSLMSIPPSRCIRQDAFMRKKPVGYRAPATSLLRSRRKLWKKAFLGVRLATIPETYEPDEEKERFQEPPIITARSSYIRPLPVPCNREGSFSIERPPPASPEDMAFRPPPTPTCGNWPTIPPIPMYSPPGLDDESSSSSSSSDDEDLDAYEFEFDLPSTRTSSALDLVFKPVVKFPIADTNKQKFDVSVHVPGHLEVDISSIYESILRDSSKFEH